MNKLINCPLDFYYRYILKFDENDEVEENIESSTFGTKIHTVLQGIFEDNFKIENGYKALDVPSLKKESDSELIRKRLTKAYTENDGSKKFTVSDLKYGQNKLSFDISVHFIATFLKKQIKEIENGSTIVPLELERSIGAILQTSIQGKMKTIRLKGKADRIDQIGKLYRILDYKSGKSDDSKLKVPYPLSKEGMEKVMNDQKSGHIRQLLMYGLMFRQTFPERSPTRRFCTMSRPVKAGPCCLYPDGRSRQPNSTASGPRP